MKTEIDGGPASLCVADLNCTYIFSSHCITVVEYIHVVTIRDSACRLWARINSNAKVKDPKLQMNGNLQRKDSIEMFGYTGQKEELSGTRETTF